MPIRIVTGPPGQRREENLTDLVAKMTGRFPVYTDDKHVKNRERYSGKKKRRM
jgi:hypothetical protein